MSISDGQASPPVLAEVPESEARGALADIYEEMRVYCAVPYVSTLQRHVATMPGCLEWMWAALRPGFVSGVMPETAWRLAGDLDLEPLPPLSDSALRLLGVDADGLETLHNICAMYVRVSPCNLIFSDCVRLLLTGSDGDDEGFEGDGWVPPAPVPELPPMPAMDAVDADCAAVLMQLGSGLGDQIMVPGLYRYFAIWPGYLAHVATELALLMADDRVRKAGSAIARRITAAAPEIVAKLPPAPRDLPRPGRAETEAILTALDTFKATSPEMIVFGTLLKHALPGAGDDD
ncbi:MAG: hypothetical protein MJE12_19635 [Alphaproteobacteria bacterium]|nr:hypothetical protein [Alphaproteobacteria bacterium]